MKNNIVAFHLEWNQCHGRTNYLLLSHLQTESLPSLKQICRKDLWSQLRSPGSPKSTSDLAKRVKWSSLRLESSKATRRTWNQDCCSGTICLRHMHIPVQEEARKFFHVLQNARFLVRLRWCKWPNGRTAIPYDDEEWRLFTGESKLSLEAVLLRNGNVKPSTPVAHLVAKEKSYESMSLLLKAINFNKSCWQVCGDLKVTGLLLGLRRDIAGSFCACGTVDKPKVWRTGHSEQEFVLGTHNVQNTPLVKSEKVFLPPLHINLWLMKNCTKSRGRYPYLRSKFPNLSDAKVKRGIFVGPQITKVMLDENFAKKLNSADWTGCVEILQINSSWPSGQKRGKLPRNHTKSLTELAEVSCHWNSTSNIHTSASFPENLRAVCDDQHEMLPQYTAEKQQRC